MLLVGHQEEHLACKNWVMGCWCGYLSGARRRSFVYVAADAPPTHTFNGLSPGLPGWAFTRKVEQEAQLSPSDRAMRLVSSNLDNYHATVQLLIRQVLTKPMVWSWRFSWRQCVINKPMTVELCISPVYWRLAVAKFFKVYNVEIAHVTLTTPT